MSKIDDMRSHFGHPHPKDVLACSKACGAAGKLCARVPNHEPPCLPLLPLGTNPSDPEEAPTLCHECGGIGRELTGEGELVGPCLSCRSTGLKFGWDCPECGNLNCEITERCHYCQVINPFVAHGHATPSVDETIRVVPKESKEDCTNCGHHFSLHASGYAGNDCSKCNNRDDVNSPRCYGLTHAPGGSHKDVCTHRGGHKDFCGLKNETRRYFSGDQELKEVVPPTFRLRTIKEVEEFAAARSRKILEPFVGEKLTPETHKRLLNALCEVEAEIRAALPLGVDRDDVKLTIGNDGGTLRVGIVATDEFCAAMAKLT